MKKTKLTLAQIKAKQTEVLIPKPSKVIKGGNDTDGGGIVTDNLDIF